MLSDISIHPPRVGWDCHHIIAMSSQGPFQSTHPVWGGTPHKLVYHTGPLNFNPPTPCGVGPAITHELVNHTDFNPPTPCGVGREDQRNNQKS